MILKCPTFPQGHLACCESPYCISFSHSLSSSFCNYFTLISFPSFSFPPFTLHLLSLTTEVLVHTLQGRVAMPDVLTAIAASAEQGVASAGGAVPGTVGVSGQAALSTGLPIRLTPVKPQLGHTHRRTHVQCLLCAERGQSTTRE
jgi:hypothetical protein